MNISTNLKKIIFLMIGLGTLVGCAEPTDGEQDEASAEVSEAISKEKHKILVNEVRSLIEVHNIAPLEPPPDASPALVKLGEALFFDKILSGNHDVACVTCHHPRYGTADQRTMPLGAHGAGVGPKRSGGAVVARTSTPLWNLHKLMKGMSVDGRIELDTNGHAIVLRMPLIPFDWQDAAFDYGVVAAQAMFPVVVPNEMLGLPGENELANCALMDVQCVWRGLMARLGAINEYVSMFEGAYPGRSFEEMTFAHAGNAIAAYELRTFFSNKSPWDKFVGRWDSGSNSYLPGDDQALSVKQLRGARHFLDTDRGNCVSCHSGSGLTDEGYHKTIAPQIGPGHGFPSGDGQDSMDDFGRMKVTGDPAEKYAWRTPPLRNVELTGPWGRQGHYEDLRDFIRHYTDPEQALVDYDITQLEDASLHSTLLHNTDEILAEGIAPELSSVRVTSDRQVNQLMAFLGALTDDTTAGLKKKMPKRVPSGLPIDR